MNAREFLAQKKHAFTERDLMKQPLSEAEAVPDAKLAAWLAANPNFVRRPLIDTGKGLEAGFTANVREKLKDL